MHLFYFTETVSSVERIKMRQKLFVSTCEFVTPNSIFLYLDLTFRLVIFLSG